jgi:fumarate hydratase class I
MDKFTEMMLAQTGLISMIGKAERGPVAIEAIRKHKSAYLMAVGGAAYLVAEGDQGAKVVGFADLGMEAIYEFDGQGHAGDGGGRLVGNSVHQRGPRSGPGKIGNIPVAGGVSCH